MGTPFDVDRAPDAGTPSGPRPDEGDGRSPVHSQDPVSVLEQIPDAFIAFDRDWRVQHLNWKAVHLLGASRPELEGGVIWDLLPEAAGLAWESELRRAADGSSTLHLEKYFRSRGAWFEIHAFPSRNGVVLYLRDISDRKWTERSLRDSDHFARTILASVGEGIFVLDRDLRCRLWNRFMTQASGLAADKVLGKPLGEILDLESHPGVADGVRRVLDGEHFRVPETRDLVPTTRSQRWVDLLFTPQVSIDGEVIGVVAIMHDVTDRRAVEERLLHSANHDPLTGLPNRSHFMEHLRAANDRARRNEEFHFALVFMDVDHFKVINDSLGHQAGDDLLLQFARRLEDSIRPGDIAARIGGDEFAVLLYDMGGEVDVTGIAQRIQASLGNRFVIQGREVFTTVSAGIADGSSGYDRPEDLLRDADTAMYRAKDQGRGRFEVFDADMHKSAVRLLLMQTDLQGAIDRGEFLLHYQPIFDIRDGNLVGFEALLRWDHPRDGLMPPGAFIHVAEDTGAIVEIGRWAAREACRQLGEWRSAMPQAGDLSVHVNLSGKEFVQPNGVSRILDIVREAGLGPGSLKLEVTESIILENAALVASALEELRGHGIELSIDDFGTGYSSLSYLHRFAFDTVKVDRSFVSGAASHESNQEIIRAIVSLSHSLGMDVIAEGVETADQLERLRRLGCDFAQGYFFSTALTAQDAAEFIARSTARALAG
jgi:diguanylate cyclase (GGDEF)-like protein/PAS domain S-box-containing protein